MTVLVAWVRKTKRGAEELMMASDSRLNGGGLLDSVPKLFLLPRTDAVIGISGNTLISYPLLTQLFQSINVHHPLKARVIDYIPMRTHLIRLINELFKSYKTYVPDMKRPDTQFLLGGYSWFQKKFLIDRIAFNPGKKQFINHPCLGRKSGEHYGFAGDWAKKANGVLVKRLLANATADFHMQPFEVVRDLLRTSDKSDTIGGAPQLVSVSQHMNSQYLAVSWPNADAKTVYLGGRKMMDFENYEAWILDPDTLIKSHLFYGKDT